MPKKKPERIHLQASEQGLVGTITSLTGNQNVESGSVEISFLDAILHADGRGCQVHCSDVGSDTSVMLYGIPIQLLKHLEVVTTLCKRDRADATITFTLKGGGLSTMRIQHKGQEVEIPLEKLASE